MFNFLKRLFRLSNKIRIIIINIIFWTILILVIYYSGSGAGDVLDGDTLLIQPGGVISDSHGEEDFLNIFISGNKDLPQNTLLRDILYAFKSAGDDPGIKRVLLDLDFLSSVGYASLEEIGTAISVFRGKGKKVYAYSSFYNQSQYYLASFADEISMDSYGDFSIDGLSVYRNYWKELLDRYNIEVNVFRAGDYKSYVEPYISKSMSGVVKDQNLRWMNSLWSGFMQNIVQNRDVSPFTISRYFEDRVSLLKEYNGDNALFSYKEGFIDILESRTQFFNKFDDIYSFTDYISAKKTPSSSNKVAIVHLEGTITYSDQGSGYISAIDTEAILDNVLNDNMDGLIVRINSGGGGVFASEIIRRKIEQISEFIPVIISMGDVCASGGYWIATAGDEIYADERTITGSIGVFGMVLGLENTMEKHFGVYQDGVSTTPYASKPSLTKNISDEYAKIFQLSIDNTYRKFINIVSSSRNIDITILENLAEGRVWSGLQAADNGLVDYIGGLNEAMEYFTNESGKKNVEFIFMENEASIFEKLYTEFSNIALLPSLEAIKEVTLFERIDDPKNMYALWY